MVAAAGGAGGLAGPRLAVCGVSGSSPGESLTLLSAGADDGDASGRRVLLEGVVGVVLSLLRAGFSGETLDPSRDRARAALLRRFPFGASPWMFHRPEGVVEWWWLVAATRRHRLGGARPWGRRGCRSGGSGRLALRLTPPCLVSALVARATWSSAKIGRAHV